MENFIAIIRIVAVVISICAALIPAVIAFLKAVKVRREAVDKVAAAKSEAERAQAEAEIAAANLEMEKAAKAFIAEAEASYKIVDDLLKTRGQSAGGLKKETVLAKLRTLAIEKGISIDVAEWSEKIDEIVKFTKQVNSK